MTIERVKGRPSLGIDLAALDVVIVDSHRVVIVINLAQAHLCFGFWPSVESNENAFVAIM